MKKVLIFSLLLSSLIGTALAQPAFSTAQQQKIRPFMELITTINLLLRLDQTKALGLSKSQAKAALVILKPLLKQSAVKPQKADEIVVEIEDDVLNKKQLEWLNNERKKTQRAAQNPNNDGRPALPAGFPKNPTIQMFFLIQAMVNDQPVNPFLDPTLGADLKNLVAQLEKR